MSDAQSSDVNQFSRIQSILWPVHRHEFKKLLPMLGIFFLLYFNYNVLRTLKDSLVVTAAGAEVIPFIKVWAMFPGAVLLTLLFTCLSNRISREKVIYTILGFFLVYFFVFVFFIYPYRDSLHAHHLADYLRSVLPVGCNGFVAMIRYWSFSLFYSMCELWSNVILFLLLWGFANQITRLGEAKRFYALFGVGGNFSGVCAGLVTILCSQHKFNPQFPLGQDAWEQTLIILISLVLIAGVGALFLFRWMQKHVLSDPQYYDPKDAIGDGQLKGKMSMRENFSYLFKSDYLINIALVVLAYNIVINLVEVIWKHEMKTLFPAPNDYNLYFSKVTTIIGVFATLTSILIPGNSIRKFGWTFTAMITPVALLLTSIGFFGAFFYEEGLSGFAFMFGTTPLALIVFLGSFQNVVSRVAKYTVFDTTQQMAFVPLEPDSKAKGKAVIDGVCSRLGKTTGSVIHQSLLIAFSTVTASAPYVAGFLFSSIAIWLASVALLGRRFNQATQGTKQALSERTSNVSHENHDQEGTYIDKGIPI